MTTTPRSTGPDRPAEPVRFTGTEFFWILISAMLIMFVANGALFYFATDRVSDFRSLIDALC